MKSALALSVMVCSLTLVSSLGATEFRVMKNAPTKKLAAFKAGEGDQSYKVGQVLNLKSESGATCSFTITKIVPEKSIYFVNTEKCADENLLAANTILNSESNDSFPLEEDKKGEEKAEAKEENTDQGLPSRNESWYTYWGLGWASPSYPSDTQAAVDTLKALGASHIGIALDLFGFYWPLADKKPCWE